MMRMKTLKLLIEKLKARNLSVAVAESCTGGYASYLLTKIPGSSRVFKGGVIVYSLDAKKSLFKIPCQLLEKNQGVSKEIARRLAKKVREKLNSDIGSSIVGFAGPAAKKGVKTGTVFIAIHYRKHTVSKRLVIKGNRDTVRKKASHLLINLLYTQLIIHDQ